MHNEDLALTNLQWLMYHKTKQNQLIYIWYNIYEEDLVWNNR